MHGCMNEWVYEGGKEWKEWMDGWTEGRMDGWMMGEWTNGRMC